MNAIMDTDDENKHCVATHIVMEISARHFHASGLAKIKVDIDIMYDDGDGTVNYAFLIIDFHDCQSVPFAWIADIQKAFLSPMQVDGNAGGLRLWIDIPPRFFKSRGPSDLVKPTTVHTSDIEVK